MDVLNEDLLKELKKIIEEEEGNGLEGFYEKLTQKLLSKEEKDGKSMLPHLRVYVSLSDKCIADAVESIIGVYLLHNGIKATIQMMGLRLGLNFSPNVPVEKNIYQTIEEVIGYKFKEKTFILQAFTHSSYSYNNITDSYERLEFLGDAVLDYLVSAYIFVEYPAYGPGKVTDARSAVVNNVTLALITIKAGLHCHLLHSEPLLLSRIDSTIASVNFENRGGLSESDLFEMRCSLLSETECPILEDIDVPKALGDVVESLLGAVFLDSGFHLPTVWEVFKRLCPQLDSLICAKPKNYVARLYELYPNRIFFTSSKKVGISNRAKGKVAKNSAAKCLMRSLVKIKELPPEII
ncbi:Uncharacterized protein FKW44_023891 [Caligus rogercresseyi]|uniref:RNase III domain-containing protein n=1 Tax=Caligus rogercresseyi TaxID=217165 RepID=A0A7T8GQH7_CALRO|nr:Uncharacterized protein FKW44_023891 [Caligus rogercresseyi]